MLPRTDIWVSYSHRVNSSYMYTHMGVESNNPILECSTMHLKFLFQKDPIRLSVTQPCEQMQGRSVEVACLFPAHRGPSAWPHICVFPWLLTCHSHSGELGVSSRLSIFPSQRAFSLLNPGSFSTFLLAQTLLSASFPSAFSPSLDPPHHHPVL